MIALFVLSVPSLGGAECLSSTKDQRAFWNEHYSPYFGSGQFLDTWSVFPGCLKLSSPSSRRPLKFINAEAAEDHIVISSQLSLYFDLEAFAELAWVFLKAETEGKTLTWRLDSYGGWLEVTLKMLEMMNQMSTPPQLVIAAKSICYSSCLLLAAGMENTYAHPEATFGFHGASVENKLHTEGTKRYLALLLELGVDPAVIDTLLSQGVFEKLEFYLMPASALERSGLFKALTETAI